MTEIMRQEVRKSVQVFKSDNGTVIGFHNGIPYETRRFRTNDGLSYSGIVEQWELETKGVATRVRTEMAIWKMIDNEIDAIAWQAEKT